MNDIAQRFAKDTAGHTIDVRLDIEGPYRHLVCTNNGSNIYRFDIVTYPGYLVISGDMGEWVFSRTRDMFEFFRYSLGKINPGYWAEKCLAGETREFSEDKFRDVVTEYVRDYFEDDLASFNEVMEAVHEDVFDPVEAHNEEPYSSLNEFEYRFESEDAVPVDGKNNVFSFTDTFELNFSEYTFHFLWALHAIVWAINGYDRLLEGRS